MQVFFGVIYALLFLTYPLMIYWGGSRLSARGMGVLVLLLLLPKFYHVARRKPSQLKQALSLPVAIGLLMLLAMLLNDARLVMAYPALVNLVFLIQFALTLRKNSVCMAERFARLETDDLCAREVAYCRAVTVIWSVFFALNGAACALLAWFASRGAWALYTGLISYLLVGLLFAGEYTLRKYLFRRFNAGLLDRIYARILGGAQT